MCEIILGWRDGFLPDGLSEGVSLLFNNRLGVYVYLSIEIDYRPVWDNKPHSGRQTDGWGCISHLLGMICCLASADSMEHWNEEATKLFGNIDKDKRKALVLWLQLMKRND